MTMQVGMVGSDGIVLASDLLNQLRYSQHGVFTTESDNFSEVATDDLIPKISLGNQVAVAWSGWDIAREVSRRILENESLVLSANRHVTLPAIARDVYESDFPGKSGMGRKDSELLIACTSELKSFYSLTMDPSRFQLDLRRKAIAGQRANAASFFLQRYYRCAAIVELEFLAAHVILSANQISRGALEGLEIVTCTKSGFRKLPEEELNKLKERSRKLDEEIETKLF